MSLIVEVNIPFTRFYDPSNLDPPWEAAGLEAVTDGSLSTYVSFDPLDSGHDGSAIYFIVDAADIPNNVLSMYFNMRARTVRLDNPPEYIAYTLFLVPFDSSSGYMVCGDGSAAHRGLEVSNYISPGAEWSSEVGVYLGSGEMAEALAATPDPNSDWFAYGETWNNVNGFATHLRNHGGVRVGLQSTQFDGAWELAEANLVFEVEVQTQFSAQNAGRVHFTGG